MAIFRILFFPARFAVILCVRWFNFAPFRSIYFLMLYAGALGYSIFFPLDIIDDLNIYMQFEAVVGPTAAKIITFVVVVSIVLFWILNVMAAWGVLIIFVIGVCSAMPPEYNGAYKMLQRFAQAKVGGKVDPEN